MENSYLYWCPGCLQHFPTQIQLNVCLSCSSQAIYLAENSIDNLSNFQADQISNQQSEQQSQLHQHHPPFIQQLQSIPLPVQQFSSSQQQQIIPAVIRRPRANRIRIMQIDISEPIQQRIGRVNRMISFAVLFREQSNLEAVTQQEINRLQKLDKTTECSICQEQEQRQGYKLECKHTFHIDCLNPWLKRANTCPVCRSHV